MKTLPRLFQTAALLLLTASVAAAKPQTLEIYSLCGAESEGITKVLQMMVPEGDQMEIKQAGQKLVVRATAEQHRIISDRLDELCAPPRNVQINVEFDTSGQSRERGAGIRPTGPINIRDGDVSGGFEVTLRNRSNTLDENITQMLVASSGKQASLRVGERVPHLLWIEDYYGRHYRHREVHVEWQDVGAFLAIEPTIIGTGPLIRIRVIPQLSGRLGNGKRHTIQFTELATEIVACDGTPVSIGGFDENKDFYSKFLVGGTGGNVSSITQITLTPKILR